MCQKQKQKQKDGIWAGLSITVVQYIVMTQKPTNLQTYSEDPTCPGVSKNGTVNIRFLGKTLIRAGPDH